jgi:hypothetical protein
MRGDVEGDHSAVGLLRIDPELSHLARRQFEGVLNPSHRGRLFDLFLSIFHLSKHCLAQTLVYLISEVKCEDEKDFIGLCSDPIGLIQTVIDLAVVRWRALLLFQGF